VKILKLKVKCLKKW